MSQEIKVGDLFFSKAVKPSGNGFKEPKVKLQIVKVKWDKHDRGSFHPQIAAVGLQRPFEAIQAKLHTAGFMYCTKTPLQFSGAL